MIQSVKLFELVNNTLANLSYPSRPEGLYDPIAYVLSLGGKRIRPVLLLMAYNLYRDDVEKALPAAIGLEMYHNYTLLHDDLMDCADLRRGHATVHKKWDTNTAILSGDTMMVLAYRHFQNLQSSKMPEVLSLFTQTAIEIGEGQQFDMNFEKRMDVSENEYIEMIRLKTSVLLACALKCGAILAGAGDDADYLYRLGEYIGLAFQLQDDYLDVYGDSNVFGKNIGGDILCNKKTYMLIYSYNTATPEQRCELNHWLQATDYDPAEKIAAVTAIYNEVGVDKAVRQLIEKYFSEGLKNLDKVSSPASSKQELLRYITSMLNRKY